MQNGNATVSVKEAAERLGISPRGVRQRISRGRLKGVQLNGEWLVYLHGEQPEYEEQNGSIPGNIGTGNSEKEHETFPGTTERGTRRLRSSVPNAEQQLQAVMNTWVQPLVEKIGSLEREVGSLEAQLEQERKEKAALVEMIEADSDISTERPPGFWRWLFGR